MSVKFMNDETYMLRALRLARAAAGNTSPNPLVGAVIVTANGEVVGEGRHERAGADHAEAVALHAAGDRARGATLYVNLEPCSHQGRTPPCADAIIRAGIARVVTAMDDPDPRVRGQGHRRLAEAGIAVTTGVAAAAAAALNRMYLHHRATGRPFVTLKMAQSLNGAVAARGGERRQLTGKRAQKYVRSLRYEHDAVMVGAGTVIVDDPQLTVRPFRSRAVPYTRIVVDARGRIPPKAKILKEQMRAPTLVATTSLMPGEVRRNLGERGIKVLECERTQDGNVHLGDLLQKLGDQHVISVLCEGGPTLAGSLLAGGQVCELVWLLAPNVLAGEESIPVVKGAAQTSLAFEAVKKLGDDLLVTATPRA
jgi:diaminohydroxyphosphoribosylaminopyrimidine deaminase/5-amino-6-(5-phosphoribosylamino)uracil reductase